MDESAWGVVPDEPPPEIAEWVEFSLRDVRLERRVVMAYLWANWMLQRLSKAPSLIDSAVGIAFEGEYTVVDISAGFIPIASGSENAPTPRGRYLPSIQQFYPVKRSTTTRDMYWTFGVVIGVRGRCLRERWPETPFANIGGFPVMSEIRAEAEDEEGGSVEYHGPIHPAGAATSACYVKPAAGKRFYGLSWSDGILIARHVLGGSAATGTLVKMQSGSTLSVADVDSATTIDAAVLDAGAGAIPGGTVQKPIYPAVAPGLTVDIAGAHTNFTATVLRVMDDPNYFGNMVAHRAFLDKYGVSGDSGALVTEQPTGDAVGVYIGQTARPPVEGLVQLMRQVTKYFEIELY